jgi:hypothetical protein
MLLGTFAGWREPSEEGPVTTTIEWVNVAI